MVAKAERVRVPHVTIFCLRHGGTHLIKPLVKRLVGLPTVDPVKMGSTEHVPLGPVVVFLRDPRDVVVAKLRWQLRREGNPGARPTKRTRSGYDQRLADLSDEEFLEFSIRMVGGWKERPGAVVSRFEVLTAADGWREARRLAKGLGCPEAAGVEALAAVIGKGHTFNANHSDHRDWFGDRARAAWARPEGGRLVSLMGYEP